MFIHDRSFVLMTGALVDRVYFGEWVIVPWNFIKVNLADGISAFYGTHPWHWYLSQGLAVVMMGQFPFLLQSLYELVGKKMAHDRDWELIGAFSWVVASYSFLQHKEFRFIMPVLPIAHVLTARTFHRMEFRKNGSKRALMSSIALVMLVNGLVFYFLSHFHQRGVVDVMHWLRRQDVKSTTGTELKHVHFLMPCHSTPYHSFLHAPNVTLDFLTCSPPIR